MSYGPLQLCLDNYVGWTPHHALSSLSKKCDLHKEYGILPFSSTFILKLFNCSIWALPGQTSQIRTKPRSSLWTKGELWGPFICCLTLCTVMRCLPNKSRIWAFESSDWMNLAIGFKWGWQSVISGVGIFDVEDFIAFDKWRKIDAHSSARCFYLESMGFPARHFHETCTGSEWVRTWAAWNVKQVKEFWTSQGEITLVVKDCIHVDCMFWLSFLIHFH